MADIMDELQCIARCEIVDWFHLFPVSSFVYNEIVEKTGGVTGRT
jgi:hypothetical protein